MESRQSDSPTIWVCRGALRSDPKYPSLHAAPVMVFRDEQNIRELREAMTAEENLVSRRNFEAQRAMQSADHSMRR